MNSEMKHARERTQPLHHALILYTFKQRTKRNAIQAITARHELTTCRSRDQVAVLFIRPMAWSVPMPVNVFK